jgi:hypothetical protein
MSLGINHVDKEDFFALYFIAHRQAITAANIISGFEYAGLVPPDAERVLSSLTLAVARTPSPALSGSTASTWVAKTPHTMKDMKRQVKHMDIEPTTEFGQVLKGYELAIYRLALSEARVAALEAANARQVRKRAKRRSVIQKAGSLTIYEGQELIRERELAEQIVIECRTRPAAIVNDAPRSRALPRCSLCESLEHNARTCLLRER